MLFERLVTCSCLMNIIATFQSPLLIHGNIPIVPFTHLGASCNQRTASEHVLGRQTTILQDWSNGCMNVTTFFVTMCDKRNDVLLTDTFCVWQPYARSHALYEFSIRQARGLPLASFRFLIIIYTHMHDTLHHKNKLPQKYRIMPKRLSECTFLCITLLLFDGNFATLHPIKVDTINLLM